MITTAVKIAIAILTSSWVAFIAPLRLEDPLRPTLILLPFVVLGLGEIGRWARGHGGRSTPSQVVLSEMIVLGALVIVSCSRGHFGLPYADIFVDGMLAGGLFLLLVHRTVRLLLALRPALGRDLAARPPLPFLVLPLLFYVATIPWTTAARAPDGDEPYYLLVAHSLAYDFDLDLRNNYEEGASLSFLDRRLEPQLGDPIGASGQQYSRHNMLLPLVLAPAYRVGGKFGALIVMAMFSAATVWMLLRLARHFYPGRPGEVLAAYAIVAFAPPLLLYCSQVWVEVPAALLILVALDSLLGLRSSGPSERRRWLVLATALVLLPLLKLRFGIVAISLLLFGWIWVPQQRRIWAWFGVCVILLVGGVILFNQQVFDRGLKTQGWDALALHRVGASDLLRGASGLFFDSSFGLFSISPLWLLVIPAGLLLVMRRDPLGLQMVVLFGPYLLFLVSRSAWFGGWSPPFRYGLLTLPLLGLALVPLLEKRRQGGARILLTSLVLITLVLAVLWMVVPGWTYNLAAGRSHLLDHLSLKTGVDVARFVPSSIRPRGATWVVPLVISALLPTLWWLPRRRLRSSSAIGIVLVVLLPPLAILAADKLPTRTVEFEDPYVEHEGGKLYPDIWRISRQEVRGGWRLAGRNELSAPIIAGGDRADIELDFKASGPIRVEVGLVWEGGEAVAGEFEATQYKKWETAWLEAIPWHRGAELTIRLLPRTGQKVAQGSLILDRARFTWDE